jgi:hypothetical protein
MWLAGTGGSVDGTGTITKPGSTETVAPVVDRASGTRSPPRDHEARLRPRSPSESLGATSMRGGPSRELRSSRVRRIPLAPARPYAQRLRPTICPSVCSNARRAVENTPNACFGSGCAIAGSCRIGLRTLCVRWTRPTGLLRSRLPVVTLDYFSRPLKRNRRPSQRLFAVQSRVVTGAVPHPHAVGR